MAMVSPRAHLSKWLVLMITIISTISYGRARARVHGSDNVTGFDKPKGAVKTIESYETREVIDCVDIYKQPAFDHPLLKNHTIQMKPSSNLKANGAGYVEGVLNQAWWKYGECPEGTIPIKRPQSHTDRHVIRSTPHLKRLNKSRLGLPADNHEYAVVYLTNGNFLGAHATINVWNPVVLDQEASFSQIWLAAGPTETVNTIETGWLVDPDSTPKEAKTFIYWTSDGYQQTGCYNLECPGFVQTSSKIALGTLLEPVSTYGGKQYDVTIDIVKNLPLGRWWLRIANEDVGYWPNEIFTSLGGGPADTVSWGGEIVNTEPDGRHTSTQMGSGHLPSEGFGKASFFRHVSIVDGGSIGRDPENLQKQVTKPGCYDVLLNEAERSQFGVNFYYGGPGFSAQCAK